MSEMRGPEKVEASQVPGWPLGQIALDVAQQFWFQNQTVAKTLVDLNTEVADFVGQRLSQDGEAIGRMTQCRSLPEVLEVETQWLRRAVDDYSKEASKLMEVNGKLIGCLVATAEQAGPNPSLAKQPIKTTG